jgi:hypothetical protein
MFFFWNNYLQVLKLNFESVATSYFIQLAFNEAPFNVVKVMFDFPYICEVDH